MNSKAKCLCGQQSGESTVYVERRAQQAWSRWLAYCRSFEPASGLVGLGLGGGGLALLLLWLWSMCPNAVCDIC